LISFILQKIGYAFLTLFGVVSVVFFLFTVLPGDPARMMLDQREDSDQMQRIKEKYGFDKPISTQYLNYLGDLSPVSYHEDLSKYSVLFEQKLGNGYFVLKYPYLRTSFQKGDKKVSEIIGETLPNTAILAISAIGISLILGLFLGAISALYANSWVDRIIAVISTIGLSLPSFFTAIIFAWVFGYLLKQYTGLSMSGNLYEIDDFGEGKHLVLKNLLLPAIVLGIRPLGVVIQLMRSSLLEVLNQDYIRTARAKGLSAFRIIFFHAFRNALNPVITAISGWFASMLAGAVFVEYIFNWNGIGKEIVAALNTLDLPVIMGSVLCISSIFIFLNVIVDLGYAWLDPRVKLS